MKINYVEGDVITPQHGNGPRILAHVVNNRGGFGAGVAKGIAETYPRSRDEYRKWHQGIMPGRSLKEPSFNLGQVQFVEIYDGLVIANMLCQNGYRSNINPVPFYYTAFELCFDRVLRYALKYGYEIHMPRVGCGLGGASWEMVEQSIVAVVGRRRKIPPIYVYDLPTTDSWAGRPKKKR